MNTENEIIEGNKLIDKFMGLEMSNIKYDSSWDCLMPVVKKFNDMCSWKSWYYHSIKLTTDIDCVWEETVSHIKWYMTFWDGASYDRNTAISLSISRAYYYIKDTNN